MSIVIFILSLSFNTYSQSEINISNVIIKRDESTVSFIKVFDSSLTFEEIKNSIIHDKLITDMIISDSTLSGQFRIRDKKAHNNDMLSVMTGIDGFEIVGKVRIDIREYRYRVFASDLGYAQVSSIGQPDASLISGSMMKFNDSVSQSFKKGIFKEKYHDYYRLISSQIESYFTINLTELSNEW